MLKTLALLLAMTMVGAPVVQAKTCRVERPKYSRKICKPKPKICREDHDRDDRHHRRHRRHHRRHTSRFCPDP